MTRPLGWLLFLLLIGFVFSVDILFPDGVQTEGRRTHTGLLVARSSNPADATFDSLKLLLANERTRAAGRQVSEVICIVPGAARAVLARALAASYPDNDGFRSIWATFEATTRLRTGACMQRHGRSRGKQYGPYLYITAVKTVRPVSCGYATFILNGRRCPAPPKPVHIDDPQAYPEKARLAGVEGTAIVEVLIGRNKEMIQCRVARSSGNAMLDQAACPTLAQNPALYASGGTTTGLADGVRRVTRRIRWQLERDGP